MVAVQVPLDALSAEALRGLIEEYVTREGTDYGHTDHCLEDKCARVLQQLQGGEAVLLFDSEVNTCNIARLEDMPEEELPENEG